MGSNSSKSSNEPVSTQKVQSSSEISFDDPRSPTPEILRTPLNGKTGTKHNITKNIDLRKTFESGTNDENLIHNNPILSAVIKSHLQSFDPRSPTVEFERTPIIIASKIDELSSATESAIENPRSPCLIGEDLDINDSCQGETNLDLFVPKNLCHDFLDMTLNETSKELEPLGSSTASNGAIEDNITNTSTAKPTQLLETNFDYVDDNLETFRDTEKVDTNLMINNKNQKSYNMDNTILKFKILDGDPRSPSVGIDRTPLVISYLNNEVIEDNVEDMSDDSLIKAIQNTNNVDVCKTATKSVEPNQAELLIYEDESSKIVNTPLKSKSASIGGSRTPLSCMKNKTDAGHARSKSANTLLNDKAMVANRNSKYVSHIPRLKSLTKHNGSSISLKTITKSGMHGDCENTPPHSHRDKWDRDNSIVL